MSYNKTTWKYYIYNIFWNYSSKAHDENSRMESCGMKVCGTKKKQNQSWLGFLQCSFISPPRVDSISLFFTSCILFFISFSLFQFFFRASKHSSSLVHFHTSTIEFFNFLILLLHTFSHLYSICAWVLTHSCQ